MKKTILLALGLFVGVCTFAQEKLTADILWKLGRVSDPRVSPDGKWVIYGVRTADVTANKSTNIIYKLDVNGGAPVPITEKSDNANSACWRPDGKKIGYMSATKEGMELWEMNPDGSDKKQLTHIADGIDLFEYAPDLKHILYLQSVR